MKKFGSFIKQKVTDFDLYPKTINFTLCGKDQFQTFFGGTVSLVIRILILCAIISLSITVFQRSNSTFSVNTIFKDITNNDEKHYFAQKDVYFAFKLRGPNPEILFDKTYFTFQLLQISYTRDNSPKGYTSMYTPIPYEFCGTKFPYVEKSIYDRLNLSYSICPKSTDFFLRSNFNSDNYESVQISFIKCNGESCKSDAEINKVLSTHMIDFSIVSSYFDFDDYVNPVHHYLQDSNFFYPSTVFYQQVGYYVKKNEIFLNDDIYFGSQKRSEGLNFYSIERRVNNFGNPNQSLSYLDVIISLDQEINQYHRSVFSIYDMLGFIGGIFGLLHTIGSIIVSNIKNKIFYSFVINKLNYSEERYNLQPANNKSRFNESEIQFGDTKVNCTEMRHKIRRITPIILPIKSSIDEPNLK